MSLDLMAVFNRYVMPATYEMLSQMIEKFNQASGGTILLNTEGMTGDFMQESFWNQIHSAQRRVDRYAANTEVSAVDLSQGKFSKVKVAGGFGPIRFEPSQMTWLQKPTAEGIAVIARQFSEALLSDQLNTAIAAGVGAIGNQADAVNDAAAAGITQRALNKTDALFGDKSSSLMARVMTGSMQHELIDQSLANAERLFASSGVRVVDILGKLHIITDAPALFEAEDSANSIPAKNKVLSLVPGAITVSDAGDIISNVQTHNGKERIESTMQFDYSFSVAMSGYGWDEAAGGKSPSDAALQTGTNWERHVQSVKHSAGVLTIGDAA